MAIQLSNALKDSMMGNYGLAVMMQYGCIRVFSGAQPASAQEAETGTLLGLVTQNAEPFVSGQFGGGLQLQTGKTAGSVQRRGTWTLVCIADGVPGWWRFVWNKQDDGSANGGNAQGAPPRIDGSVGESLLFPSNAICAAGKRFNVLSFSLILP